MIKHNDICITEDPGMGRNEQEEYRNNGKKFSSFDEEQPMHPRIAMNSKKDKLKEIHK